MSQVNRRTVLAGGAKSDENGVLRKWLNDGLNVALEAYKIFLNGDAPAVVDGFTGVQRCFLGFGQIWRTLIRDEQLRRQVVSEIRSRPPARGRSRR